MKSNTINLVNTVSISWWPECTILEGHTKLVDYPLPKNKYTSPIWNRLCNYKKIIGPSNYTISSNWCHFRFSDQQERKKTLIKDHSIIIHIQIRFKCFISFWEVFQHFLYVVGIINSFWKLEFDCEVVWFILLTFLTRKMPEHLVTFGPPVSEKKIEM